MTITALLRHARAELANTSPSAQLDAEVLLAWALAKPRSFLYAWPEHAPTTPQQQRFQQALARRGAGEPLAYIIGRREFWSLELEVSPATLIPRPETELVVAQALERIPPEQSCHLADLGTGCGAIALALARERPQAQCVATDSSTAALALARANAARLGMANIDFYLGDWCSALPGQDFAAIVANPPYIAAASPYLTRADLRWEPRQALEAGADGLAALRVIIMHAPDYLTPDGWLWLEHGFDQGTHVADLLRARGFHQVTGYRDGAGHDRVCGGQWLG